MSKYTLLAEFLNQTDADCIELTFKQIETIIKTPLPFSAYSRTEWWANDSVSHSQSKSGWLSVKWKVKTINLQKQIVNLCKV